MEFSIHSGRDGQSLVELLVGIAIGAIFILGAATIIAPSLSINKQTTIVQTKTELATELAGNIKAWAAGNWDAVLSLATGTANTYYLSTATSSFAVIAATTTIVNTGGSSPGTISIISAAPTSTTPQETVAATFTQSFSTLPQAGDLIAVVMTENNTPDVGVASVTDNQGNGNYLLAASSSASNDTGGAYIYYAKNIKAPSGTFTVTIIANATTYLDIGIYDIRGADPSNPVPAGNTTSTTGNGTNVLTGTLSPGTNIVYIGVLTGANINFSSITPTSTWTQRWRELADGVASMDTIDLAASTNQAAQWTISSDPYTATLVAFNAQSIANSGSSTFSSGTTTQSVGEFVNSGSTNYSRYFYVSDVYRDSNGNVTTTASGNNYDPSTKLITVVVQASSTPATPALTSSFYLTRNGSNNFTQTSWAGSSGQSNPVTIAGTNFYADSDVTITATGSIQLTAGGSSCTL